MKAPIPQVQSRPLGSPRVDIDTRGTQGEQVGAAMGQLASNADRMAQQYDQAMRFHDTAQTNRAATDWEERAARRLYGDKANGVRGVLEAEGEGAFEAAYGPKGPDGQPTPNSSIYDALQKDREEIAKALGNERQKQLFDEHVKKSMVGVHRQVEAHVTAQSRVAAQRTAEARAQIELNKVANTFADVETREDAIAAGADALRATALSKEDGEARALKFRSDAAKVTIAQFLSPQVRDVKSARAYFATVKELLGKDAVMVEDSIHRAELAQAADAGARKLVASHRIQETGWVDEKAVWEAVNALPNEEERQAIQKLLPAYLSAEDQVRKDAVGHVFDRALTAWLGSKNLSAIDATDEAWLRKRAPKEWEALENRAKQLSEYYRVAGGRKPEPTPAEREAFLDFLNDIAEHPANYAKAAYTPELFRAQWGLLLAEDDLDRAGRIVFGPTGVKQDQYKGAGEFGRFVGAEINSNPTLKTPEDQKRFRGFMGELRRAHIAKEKREPTLEEMEAMRAKAFILRKQKRGPWGLFGTKEVPAYKAAAEDKKNPPPPPKMKMNWADRAAVLHRRGVPPEIVKEIVDNEIKAGILQ